MAECSKTQKGSRYKMKNVLLLMVDVSGGQPACRMLGAGFVKLRQRGSLCRRKLRRGDTLLPRRAHVSEGKGVSPCIPIQPEGGDVQGCLAA